MSEKKTLPDINEANRIFWRVTLPANFGSLN